MNKQLGFTLVELMIAITIIGILSAIAITQYQSYVVRTQFTRVMSDTGIAKAAIETCLLAGKIRVGNQANECDPQAIASNLLTGASQIGATLPMGTGVPQVTIQNTGVVIVEATFGNNAAQVLLAQRLTWQRNADGAWNCSSTVQEKYKVLGCNN